MRRAVATVSVAIASLTMSISAAIAGESTLIYLLPDSTDRYRPAVATSTGASILADVNTITPPALSPDGTRIAFSGSVGDESLGRYALFVVDLAGSNLIQLTSGSYAEFDPAWSPDGQTVVVSQNPSGSISGQDCCHLALVDVGSGSVTPLTAAIGAARPSYSPDGQVIVFDTPSGVWKVSAQGGSPVRIATVGYDATVSPDGQRIAYLVDGYEVTQLRVLSINSGTPTIVYSTSDKIEAPHWAGGRIYFFEFTGLGYDGRSNVSLQSVGSDGSVARMDRSFPSHPVGMSLLLGNDEIFFYRDDGAFAFYDVSSDASLGTPIQSGTGFSAGWTSISAIDLEGDGSDEMLFYRAEDGAFKYYDMKPNATLGSLILSGTGYSTGWDSITRIDLDGDGQDEVFFYRSDGTYRFYDIDANASLGAPIRSGSDYSVGWSSISAIDLDGDGRDEMLFYRGVDGTFKYYDVLTDGRLGSLIRSGTGYSTGWTSIAAIDLDGDEQDEILFYRDDGTYRYYDIIANASLGAIIRSGSDYELGWTSITRVDVDD